MPAETTVAIKVATTLSAPKEVKVKLSGNGNGKYTGLQRPLEASLSQKSTSPDTPFSKLAVRARVHYEIPEKNDGADKRRTTPDIKARVSYTKDKKPDRVKPVYLTSFEHVKNLSPILHADKEAVLDEKTEVDRYFKSHSEAYMSQLRALDAQIGAPMSEKCRMAICIPAFREEQNIYRTLSTFLNQKRVNLSEIEIIILDNHKKAIAPDNTETEVHRFQKDHPELPVRYAHLVFPGDTTPPLGIIRKVSLDLALLRHRDRTKPIKNFVLATNDADGYGFKDRAFEKIFTTFTNTRATDLLLGKNDYPIEAYTKFPTLHAIRRFEQYMRRLSESQKIRTRGKPYEAYAYASSACCFFRPEIYAAVGGWNSIIQRGSDVNFITRVCAVREDSTRHSFVTNRLRLYTDPRRSLNKMMKGQHHVHMYDDKEWQESPVAGTSYSGYRNLAFLETFDRQYFQDSINEWITVKYPGVNIDKRRDIKIPLDRTLNLLGVRYELHEGKVVLINTAKLERQLREFRERELVNRSELAPVIFTKIEPLTAVSDTLRVNPEAFLNERNEINMYLSKQSPDYLTSLRNLNTQIGKPLKAECKITVVMPAYHEGKNIEQIMSSYVAQIGIQPAEFELIIYDNHRMGLSYDDTQQIVRRFQKRYPNQNIHYIQGVTPRNSTVGFLRKTVVDLALLRQQERLTRIQNAKELTVLMTDADTVAASDALQSAMRHFDQTPNLHLIGGADRYPAEAMKRFPVLAAIKQFETIMYDVRNDAHRRQTGKEWPIRTPGFNTSFRAKSYATIGGYDPARIRNPGEDTELGLRMRSFWKDRSQHELYVKDVIVYPDPRRGLVKMSEGKTHAQIWEEDQAWHKDKKTAGKDWRDFDIPELEVLTRQSFQRELDGWLDYRIPQIRKQFPSTKSFLQNIKPFLNVTAKEMGFTYHIDGDRIVVDDTAMLETRLNSGRRNGAN